MGVGLGLRYALRHDASRTSVSNNFVHIRRNWSEPFFFHLLLLCSVEFGLITSYFVFTLVLAPDYNDNILVSCCVEIV